MTATVSLHLFSIFRKDIQDFQFFEANNWTPEIENQLLAKMQDLLSIIRAHSNKLEININAEVSDIDTITFLIRKKSKQAVTINNQQLTIREIEVLGLIMQGLTNNEIAAKLFVSFETVKSHRKNILRKTGARNTAALINYYHQTFFEK